MRRPFATGNPYLICAPRCAVIAVALVAILLPTGCVRRRLNVRSNPPGAVVFVDNQEIGTTPCSVDFVYYGTREIRLVKPGYETLTVNQPIPTPWYQIPPIDFVSDNLLPNTIQDHRTVAFNLEPQIIVPTEQLIERADQLRQDTRAGVSAALPGAIVAPGPSVPPSTVAPGATPVPTLAPTDTFAPAPTLAPGQAATAAPGVGTQPVPLPPVEPAPMNQSPTGQAPAVQQPFMQGGAPAPYGQATPVPAPPYGQTAPAANVPTVTAPPTTTVPPTGAATTGTPAPFSPPPLQSPPAGTRQGPPLVSPPLR